MHLHITNNLVSYHSPSGHQTHSQDFFLNAEQLIGFLLQSIAVLGKKHWERGSVGMHHCWVFKLNNNKQFSYGKK